MSTNKTVMMKLNRNYTLRSTLGHMLTFKKDVPMPIPQIMVYACAQIGAERVDGKEVFVEPEAPKSNPVDPGQRLNEVLAAFDGIVEKNDSRDFTASGIPKVSVMSKAVGYAIDRTEVMKAWEQRLEALAEANETE